jgi:hypothetical protein
LNLLKSRVLGALAAVEVVGNMVVEDKKRSVIKNFRVLFLTDF